jgi:hypothetical protein
MAAPRVSIITPAFNAGLYIAETVESVLAQTGVAFEYIVVDDGSTDDTLARLAPYRGRLRLIDQANAGEAAAVNAGYRVTRGALIAIVNADDPVLPGWLAAAVDALDTGHDLVGVYPDWLRIDDRGEVIAAMNAPDYDYGVLFAQHLCLIGPGCVFRRTALAGELPRDPRFRYTGDYHQWLRMGLRGPFARIPRTLATWREHAAGASQARRNPEMAANKVDVIRDLLARPALANPPPSVGSPASLRRDALSTAYYIAAVLGLDDRTVPAQRYMWRSLWLAPRWPRGRHPERQRSWRLVVFALGLPLTRPLVGLYRRLRPARFQPRPPSGHYRDWTAGPSTNSCA